MASKSTQFLPSGSVAPAFELKDTSGKVTSLEEILSRGPALVFFYKVSCPVCQLSAPFVDRIATGSGMQVIGISQDDAKATVEFNKRFGVRFPVLIDDGKKGYAVSNAYGINSVPTLFVIETDGEISTSFSGFSKSDFEELGQRTGAAPFLASDQVPAFRAG